MKKQNLCFSLPSRALRLCGEILLLLLLFLSGCVPDYLIARAREIFIPPQPTFTAMPPPALVETPTLAQKVVGLSTLTPTEGLRITRLPTLTPTVTTVTTATATRAATATPTPARAEAGGAVPLLSIQSELPVLDEQGTVALHGVILFKSLAPVPFNLPGQVQGSALPAPLTRAGEPGGYSLWAVSLDGASAGRLNPAGRSTDLIISDEGRAVVVKNGFILRHPLVDLLALPPACADEANPCDQVQLSADGFVLGARYGPDECGRGLLLVNQLSGEPILDYNFGVHNFAFLPNGRLEFDAGSCENGIVTFVDPYTGAFTPAGEQGRRIWNAARTLFVTEAQFYGGGSSVWAYRLSDGAVFTPFSQGSEGSVLFMQDDQRFLFESIAYPSAGQSPDTTPAPMRIMRFDPRRNELVQLAGEPRYHYRLCQRDEVNPCPLAWYGDWIQIQRVPFDPPAQPPDPSALLEDVFPCLYGRAPCPGAEAMALNAYTGEVIPFDPSQLPQMAVPTPTATPGPVLAGKPVYEDPGGRFAFYVGRDGHSLWLAPTGEPAVLWVKDGEAFVYLP